MILFTIINKKEQAINLCQNILIPMMPFAIKNKKEQAINLRQKYFHLYDTLYFIINKRKQAKIYNHSMYN